MEFLHDGNGTPYLLVGEPEKTQFRITGYTAPGLWSGEGEIRIVRQIGTKPDATGPSIPLSMLGDLSKAITEMLIKLKES